MGYDGGYFQQQITKSDDKIAWQYGRLVSAAGLSEKRGLRVLDAGCGAGPGLRYLAARGFCAFGTDLVSYPLQVAQQLVPSARLAQSDLDSPLPFASGVFDLILLSEVVEHVEAPAALLADCRRVLRLGGAVVATTPNLWDVRKFWQGARWSGSVDPTHKHLFNPRSLAALLRVAGFAQPRVRAGYKPLFWISSRVLRLRAAVPGLPLIGNTLIAVAHKDGQAP